MIHITPVVRAVIEHEGHYLLVQHRGEDFWCLPGGKAEEGEDLVDALQRELKEELGLEAQVGRLLYVQQLFKEGDQRLEFFFLISNGTDFDAQKQAIASHATELAGVEFKDVSTTNVLPEFLKTELPGWQATGFDGDVRFKAEHA